MLIENKVQPVSLKKEKTVEEYYPTVATTAGQLLSLKNNLLGRSSNEEHDVPFRNNNRKI